MSKEVSFRKEAIEKMLIGIDKTADAVGSTIGPKGLNVFIDDPMTPRITNDGVSIAVSIDLEDKLENAGAYIIKNTAAQTNDDVGDGTTTTTVLTQSLIHECLKRPENAMVVEQSLKEASSKAIKQLINMATPIGIENAEKVALISSENKKMSKLIGEIIEKLGTEAVINVEDSDTSDMKYEIVDGYEANVGYLSPYFITDKKAAKAVYSDVPVLVVGKKISNLAEIAPIFQKFKEAQINQCVIVCEDIDDSMLGVFVASKSNPAAFQSVVIRATGELLDDIAGAVNAKVIASDSGVNFSNMEITDLGMAKKVICGAKKTIFLGSDSNAAYKYSINLESKAKAESNQYIKEKMMDRVNRLRGSVAILKIGASTDLERGHLRDKADDAVKSVKAALEEGIVEGGGMALYHISEDMEAKTLGEQILKVSLTSPVRRIIENAGKDYTEVIKNMPDGYGYDAKTDRYRILMDDGIIDPVKVERCSLENAVSAAAKFITTNAAIYERQDSDAK